MAMLSTALRDLGAPVPKGLASLGYKVTKASRRPGCERGTG